MLRALAIAIILISSMSFASANYMIPPDTPHKNDLSISNGDLKYQGITILSRDEAKTLAKDKVGVSIFINAPGKVRSYDVAANNGLLKVAGDTSYILSGKRWNMQDPQLKFVLKTDANLATEGLQGLAVQAAFVAAASTWDAATSQNLFADSGTIAVSPAVTIDSYNKINTIGWKLFLNNCLAYSRTWYKSTLVDGYKTIVDSDIVFNTKYPWRTSGTVGADVQTIALHELGHSLGLGDLYASGDSEQVMYGYYKKVKTALGAGDKAGLMELYG